MINCMVITIQSKATEIATCVPVGFIGVEKRQKKTISTTCRQRPRSVAKDDDAVVVVDTRFSDMEESVRYRVNG